MLLTIFASFGCVAQGELDDMQTSLRSVEEQNVELRAQLEAARANIAAIENRPLEADPSVVAENERLRQELANAERLLREMNITPLPEELNRELLQLVQQYPQLMSYDEQLGMVKLANDLTFASGSDKVGPEAQAGLRKLAAILNSPSAGPYEVRIVGHTDNVPIVHSIKAHPTNWHLSVHRSIAVKDVLAAGGVANVRLNVAGYGQYRPIVPNARGKGAQANRRVEIFLVPSIYREVEPGAAPAGEAPPADAAPAEDPAQFK